MAGPHTLAETERQVADRLGDLTLDFEAMAVVSNLFRAANAVRNHLERSVLAPADLTWTAFVVLWVVWIWGRVETRTIAAEGASRSRSNRRRSGITRWTRAAWTRPIARIERASSPSSARRWFTFCTKFVDEKASPLSKIS